MNQLSTLAEKFLQEPRHLVLATLSSDGTPHQTIVWFEFSSDTFKISTTTERMKYINMKRDPRASVLVYDKEDDYKYVAAQCRVEDTTTEGAHDFIEKLSQKYMGKKYYGSKAERDSEDRVTVTLEPYHFYIVGL